MFKILIFVLFWLLISFIMASSSGWRDLARNYKVKLDEFKGGLKTFGGCYIGNVSYGNMLHVAVNKDGILLKMIIIFRFGHSTIFLPWDSISKVQIKKTSQPEESKNKIVKLVDKMSNNVFGQLKLSNLPEYKLVIPWIIDFNKYIPKSIEVQNGL